MPLVALGAAPMKLTVGVSVLIREASSPERARVCAVVLEPLALALVLPKARVDFRGLSSSPFLGGHTRKVALAVTGGQVGVREDPEGVRRRGRSQTSRSSRSPAAGGAELRATGDPAAGSKNAAAILRIKETAFQVWLKRPRRRIDGFLRPRCEHIDPCNPCYCAGLLPAALEQGFVTLPTVPQSVALAAPPTDDIGVLYRSLPGAALGEAERERLLTNLWTAPSRLASSPAEMD